MTDFIYLEIELFKQKKKIQIIQRTDLIIFTRKSYKIIAILFTLFEQILDGSL